MADAWAGLQTFRRIGRAAAAVATLLACTACSMTNPYYDPQKPHHTATGFRNNYLVGDIGGSLLKWQVERIRDHLPPPPENGYAFPVDAPDLAWLATNRSQPSATWIGHATMLVQVGGVNVLTDPVFSERASPVPFAGPKRHVRPGLAIAELPHIDVVVISHNHYDHLDRASVAQLNAQDGGPPLFLVPLGIAPWMRSIGITHVRELDWWQHTSAAGLTITFVPVQHWSARGVTDRFKTLWGGWIIQAGPQQQPAGAEQPQAGAVSLAPSSHTVFFAGDTGYSRDFADIHQRFPHVDLALLPIGAYAPRWFMRNQHVEPAEAVQIHRDLHARQSIAIHWGTFELTDEALDAPPKALAQELAKAGVAAADFAVLRHGETRRF